MKRMPTKPGTYIWLPVSPGSREIEKMPYIIRVYEDGRFWCPLQFDSRKVIGVFVEVPDDMLSQLESEAHEMFIEAKIKEISQAQPWDQRRMLESLSVDSDTLEVIKMRLKAANVPWRT